MKFYMKLYERTAGYLVAVCDKEVCGKKLKFEDIEVHVNPRFYKGELVDEKEVIKALRVAFAANLFGKECIKLAVDNDLVNEENVLKIEGIPHAHTVRADG